MHSSPFFDFSNPFVLVGHAAYVCWGVGYLMRDILSLRVAAAFASCCALFYFGFVRPQIDWLVIGWQLVFLAINVVWIGLLLRERHGFRFSEDEKELYATVFRTLSPIEFMKMMRLAQWREVGSGTALATSGVELPGLTLIYSGTAEVLLPMGGTRQLKDGAFIGEMSFIRGGAATADVVARTPLRIVFWDREDLKRLLQRNPALETSVQRVFSEDLAKKLQHGGAAT